EGLHLPFIDNVPLVLAMGIDARQDLHQRRFAGTVFANQRVNFAAAYRKGDVVERLHARKILGDVAHLEDDFAHDHAPAGIMQAAGPGMSARTRHRPGGITRSRRPGSSRCRSAPPASSPWLPGWAPAGRRARP